MSRVLVLFGLLTVSACAAGEAPIGPPEIAWGERECDRCRMIVSEPRTAGAVVSPEGEAFVFDDVACLAAFVAEARTPPEQVWVHDHESGEWIDARSARYERRENLVTPMGSGLVALSPSVAAGKQVLTFRELTEESEDVR